MQAPAEMVNESFKPTEEEEEILELLQEGRGDGDPWGYTTPAHVREQLGIKAGNDSYHLNRLESAGWIERVARGFYRFIEDPRN